MSTTSTPAPSTEPRATMPVAVLHGPGDLRVEARPVPRAGPGEVLVEVSHCGVCGTDLHMVLEGWGRPGSVGGHEWSGRVRATGPGADRFAPGDAVVGGAAPGCASCPPCRRGRTALCEARDAPGAVEHDGAFAGYVCADERSLVPVPAGLDLRTAVAEPLAVALHALTRGGVQPGHRAMVAGAGPIGALVILALRARGVDDIVVSEPNPARRGLAAALGASSVLAPDQLEVPTIAEPRRLVDGRVDVAFECSGKASAMEAACAQLGVGGRLVLVGAGIEPPRFDPNRILLNELEITGAFEYDPGGIAAALDLLASGVLDTRAVVEPEDVDLAGLLGALRGLAAGTVTGKVLVAPNAPAPAPAPDAERRRDADAQAQEGT